MRSLTQTLGLLLALAAYLWGGCVPCRQWMERPAPAKAPAKNCCSRDHCRNTSHEAPSEPSLPGESPRECAAKPAAVKQAQDPGPVSSWTAARDASMIPADETYQTRGKDRPRLDSYPIANSPPDLVLLNASFLI